MQISPKLDKALRGLNGLPRDLSAAAEHIRSGNLTDSMGDFFDINKEGFVTYTPANKLEGAEDGFKVKGRTKVKPGRWLRRLVKENGRAISYNGLSDGQIEQFGYELAAQAGVELYKVRIVKGEDIRYWYHEQRYAANSGSLRTSCMRSASCQPLFDVYVENPDVCSLAIITDQSDKLLARAILWDTVDGKKMIDRIYGSDYARAVLTTYAAQQGWINVRALPAGTKTPTVRVQLKKYKFDRFPSFDTLWYSNGKGLYSNKHPEGTRSRW